MKIYCKNCEFLGTAYYPFFNMTVKACYCENLMSSDAIDTKTANPHTENRNNNCKFFKQKIQSKLSFLNKLKKLLM